MKECTDEARKLTASLQYSGNSVNLPKSPEPFSWEAMVDRAYDINKIYIQDLHGSNEAANELLDFTVEKTVPVGLE